MPTRKGLLLAAGLWIGLVGTSWAQDAPDLDAARLRIVALLDEGQARLLAGQSDWALELFNEANDLTFEVEGLGDLYKHRPNLFQARYYKATGRWQSVDSFASSVVSALDEDGLRDHPFRLEAMLLQGEAADALGRGAEAERLLRRVVEATADRPETRRLWEEATFALASVASGLGTPDAADLRRAAIDGWHPGHPRPIADLVAMKYRHLFEARSNGTDPGVLLPLVQDFMAGLDGTEGIPEADMSFYRGFLGLVLLETGDYEAALPLFEARHRYLLDTETYGAEFFWNVQRIALARFNIEDAETALAFLQDWVPRWEKLGASVEQAAILTKNIGELQEISGDDDAAQESFRAAYALMRRVRRSSDRLVLDIARHIDPEAPGMADFPLRHEIAGTAVPDFELDVLGSDVVRLFFAGDWRGLEARLDSLRRRGETPLFLLNEALFLAITGEFEAAQASLDKARRLSRQTLDSSVPPNSMVFDVVDVVSKVWATAHRRDEARSALDRLKARLPTMTRAERSVYLALEVFYVFRDRNGIEAQAAIERWIRNYEPSEPKTVWEIFAATMVLEAATVNMPEEVSLSLLEDTLTDLEAFPDMVLAETYARLVLRINGATALLTEGAVTELGAMVQEVSTLVPPHHSIIGATQFGMANALSWRGRWAEALEWMERATETMRANPYTEPDVLAFLISEQANLLTRMGDSKRAAVLAREAFEAVDPYTARNDLMAGILETYAAALWNRTGDANRAVELYARYLNDPRFFARMPVAMQIRLLDQYASATANVGSVEEVRAIVDRADKLVPDDLNDWRMVRASLAWNRAIAEYWAGEKAVGLELMLRSNELYVDWRDDMFRKGAADEIGQQDLQARATWTALIAYDYAESLPQ